MRSLFVVAVIVLANACSGERMLGLLNTITADSHYLKVSDLRYGIDPRHTMDWYQPAIEGESNTLSGLLIVFVHGGAWREGDKNQYEFVAASLTRDGHEVLIPNYRLYPQVTFPAFIDDIAAAIAAFENINPFIKTTNNERRKVVLIGHSSGAHQVALLTTDPSYLSRHEVNSEIVALIALAGPYDLPLDNAEVASVFPDLASSLEANPVQQVTEGDTGKNSQLPPVLLLHGRDDERVALRHTEKFAAALEKANVSVQVEIVERGHAGTVLSLSYYLQFLNESLHHIQSFLSALTFEDLRTQ